MTLLTVRWTAATFLFVLSVFALSQAFASPPSSAYSLIFADEFSGTSLDSYKWNTGYPWGNGHTHNHLAACYDSNLAVSDGALNITAKKEVTTVTGTVYNYTSGVINTQGKLNINSGYLEASIQIPSNMTGMWPAFWMLGAGWPPEIDIMEVQSPDTNSYWANYHYTYGTTNTSYGWETTVGTLNTSSHIFAVDWTSTNMTFYLDGVYRHSITDTAAIADAVNMYLILNLAVGGAWGGGSAGAAAGTYPETMTVDWVRVWQNTSNFNTSTVWKGSGSGTLSWTSTSNWTNGVAKSSCQTASFNSVARSSVIVDWSNSQTIAGISLGGTTSYTLGGGNESLMLANVLTNSPSPTATFAYVNVSGSQSHTIKSRLEAYSTIVVNASSTGILTLAGEITGPSSLIFASGNVLFTGRNSQQGTTSVVGTGTNLVLAEHGSLNTKQSTFEIIPTIGSGTVTIQANSSASLSGSHIYLAGSFGGTATLDQLGGNVIAAENINVGYFGKGTYTLSGGASSCVKLRLATATGASGTVILNSGATLTAQAIFGGYGTSAFNFNGGTVKAAATASAFLDKLTYANIQAGGAIFDTNGYDVGIAQALIDAPSVHGSLTKQGAGTLTLSGSNTYSGTTYVNAGALSLAPTTAHNLSAVVNNAAFEIAHGSVTVDSVTGAGSTYVADGILVVGTLVQDSLFLGQAAPESATAATEAVPEPAACFTMIIAAATLLAALRRQRRLRAIS